MFDDDENEEVSHEEFMGYLGGMEEIHEHFGGSDEWKEHGQMAFEIYDTDKN